MMRPKVSVILPVFNGELFVERAMQSVFAQTLDDFELIIINDGSEDGTERLVRALADKRTTVISQTTHGLASSRNTGVAEARGEYLAFLDADDLWLPTKLEMQMRWAKEEMVVYSNVLVRNESTGVDLGDFAVLDRFPQRTEKFSGRIGMYLLSHNFIHPSTVIMHRRDFEVSGGFRPGLRACEDWDLWLRCAGRVAFHRVEEPLVVVNVRSDSLQSDTRLMRESARLILDDAKAIASQRSSLSPEFRGAIGIGYFVSRNMSRAAANLLGALIRQPLRRIWWRYLLATLAWRPVRLFHKERLLRVEDPGIAG